MSDLIIDGFAGPGGWSEGLRLLGLRDIGLEWDWHACKTRAAAGHLTIQTDISAYPTAPLKGRSRRQIWSPPCQAWSRAGKGLGLIDQPLVHQAVHDLAQGRDTRAELLTGYRDERSLLAAEPMRWLYDLRPEWVCMEEVPDVLTLWKQYAEYLRGWGYSVWTGILNAADYGVPQTRKRAILIASRLRPVTAPEPTHAEDPEYDLFGECLNNWTSMAEALGLDQGGIVNTRGERKTPGGNEFPSDGPSQALTGRARSWTLHTNRDQRADGTRQTIDPQDKPAPTFTSKSGGQWVLVSNTQANAARRRLDEPASTLFFGHRGNAVNWTDGQEKRPLELTEAAILQSFRADYPWQGSKTKAFEQIGNAVPPLLAAHIVSAATGIPVPQPAAVTAA
ncbi:DNA cytosine methyltransferase [Streptomyces sp. H27-H5]|uniref:DNA cytosine methyltransferase n=1 Tax=Streptomyces sp. H27-H5 TaxID=2996460 RepID=UPI00226F1030|nr:DNA cytosine methyltransferase [Streptomyces sp. H27-H5]MCY0959934.1 DNA cytosine methyltransferase [Streptomyces sp. H27-H5]